MLFWLYVSWIAVANEVETPVVSPIPPVVAVGSRRGWHCSGVVVDVRHVLTARHCLPVTRVGQGLSTHELSEVRVSEVVPYPRGLDAVLLRLDGNLLLPTDVAEIGPLRTDVDERWAWGYGLERTEDGLFRQGHRHHIALTDAAVSPCDVPLAQGTGCVRGELVIQGSGYADTCNGDSGGPVLERMGQIWTWVGVVSRPVGQAQLSCGDGGVYVAAMALENWLKTTIDEE